MFDVLAPPPEFSEVAEQAEEKLDDDSDNDSLRSFFIPDLQRALLTPVSLPEEDKEGVLDKLLDVIDQDAGVGLTDIGVDMDGADTGEGFFDQEEEEEEANKMAKEVGEYLVRGWDTGLFEEEGGEDKEPAPTHAGVSSRVNRAEVKYGSGEDE